MSVKKTTHQDLIDQLRRIVFEQHEDCRIMLPDRYNDAAVKMFLRSIYYKRVIDADTRRRLWRILRAYLPAMFEPWYADPKLRRDPFVQQTKAIYQAMRAFRADRPQ